MYELYKALIFGPLKTTKEILTVLSKDLYSIDIAILEDQFLVIDDIVDEDEKLKEIAILCRDKIYSHPQWSLLAGRVRMIYVYRNTPPTFREAVEIMKPVLGNKFYKFCINNELVLENMIQRDLDWNFDIFSVETQIRGYLTKINDAHGKSRVVETPQYKNLRIATYLWYETNEKLWNQSLNHIKQTYLDISHGKISPASPTQFNAGMKRPQLSSCFLMGISDNLESLSNSWKYSAIISMINGGIGMTFDSIRHSEIGNTGQSKGIVPWIKIQNEVLSTVDQCFHPDTIVYTIKDGPKRIADIGPGEKLIINDGTTNKVARPIVYNVNKKTGEFYRLYSSKTSFVTVSGCHPILSIGDQSKTLSYEQIIERLNSKRALIEYTSVADLDESSFIGIPIPSYERDLPFFSINDCRMYGILLASGFISSTGKTSVLIKSINSIEFIKEYLSEKLIEFDVIDLKCDDKLITWVAHHHIFPITRNMLQLYNNDDINEMDSLANVICNIIQTRINCRICPSFLNLPYQKLKFLIRGIIENIPVKANFVKISGNLQFLESLKYIFMRLRMLSTLEKSTDNFFDWELNIPAGFYFDDEIDKNLKEYGYFEYDNKLWYKLVKKEKIDNNDIDFENVYDLEMESISSKDTEISANYTTTLGIAHNGGKRKGSGCMYLTDWHTDIIAFIDLKEPFGKDELRAKDLFYGIMVSDLFMKRVEDDDMWTLFCPAKTNGLEKTSGKEFEKRYIELENKIINGMHLSGTRRIKARELWVHILNSQISTGMPFLLYKDACNRKSNQQHMGTLRTSNLCVAGDTFILTDKGQIRIGENVGKTVNVWNGIEWSETTIRQTGSNVDLLKVQMSDGTVLKCTPEHKFYITDKYNTTKYTEVCAKELKKGDILIKNELSSLCDTTTKFNHPYTHGFYCGSADEKVTLGGNNTPLVNTVIKLYPHNLNSLAKLEFITTCVKSTENYISVVLPVTLSAKYSVPHLCNIKDKLKWLEGYTDAKGMVCIHKCKEALQLDCYDNQEFLFEIKLLLQTLNVQSILIKVIQSSVEHYRLIIDNTNLHTLLNLGFTSKLIFESKKSESITQSSNIKIVSITEGPRAADTFCFTEPKRHMGVFNGVLTGQCTEILEYIDEEHIASCNLASIPLSKFVKDAPRNLKSVKIYENGKYFDFTELGQVTRRVVRNLSQTINRTYYPKDVPQVKFCNMKTRPLGIGVQDLAGCFALLDLCWDSKEAAELNEKIARVMYYHGMEENIIMAEEMGAYPTFPESPASKGLFQFDLWTIEKISKMNIPILDISFESLLDLVGKILCAPYLNETVEKDNVHSKILDIILQLRDIFGRPPCDEFDWDKLRIRMIKSGLYFSLLFAQMPTASSAQILGNNESTECYTQYIFSRTVLSGQFAIVPTNLVNDLEQIDMWNTDILKHLIANSGSIKDFPADTIKNTKNRERFIYLQKKYRTVYEYSQKVFADLYLDRAKYQCQTSSNNLFMKSPTLTSLNAYHFYMWKGGAKTGMYYLRQMNKTKPLNFALNDIKITRKIKNDDEDDDYESPICLTCQS